VSRVRGRFWTGPLWEDEAALAADAEALRRIAEGEGVKEVRWKAELPEGAQLRPLCSEQTEHPTRLPWSLEAMEPAQLTRCIYQHYCYEIKYHPCQAARRSPQSKPSSPPK
jgi:hypothetical protein